jgi:hypothetical protein
MFGPYSKNKALCSCGSLADLDSAVVSLKGGLGKRVECRECRNKRIAREHEMLEKHFSGEEEQEEDW